VTECFLGGMWGRYEGFFPLSPARDPGRRGGAEATAVRPVRSARPTIGKAVSVPGPHQWSPVGRGRAWVESPPSYPWPTPDARLPTVLELAVVGRLIAALVFELGSTL
jgi:hypothetical protein